MKRVTNRIQISSRQKAKSGKSTGVLHNKNIAKLDKDFLSKIDNILVEYEAGLNKNLIPTFDDFNINNIKIKDSTKDIKDLNEGINDYLKKLNSLASLPNVKPSNERPPSTKSMKPLKEIDKNSYKNISNNIQSTLDNFSNFDNQDDNLDNDLEDEKHNLFKEQAKLKKKLPKISKKKNKPINPLKNKDGFLTGVGLTKETKKLEKLKRENKFLAKTDQEIKDILYNIDSIDDFIKKDEKFDGSPDYKARMERNKKDFDEILREIDEYKNEMKEEFDEIQYLIKFTNNTEKLIDRHKNVIGNIFKCAGLSKVAIEEEDENKDKKKRNKSVKNKKINGYLEVIREVEKVEKEFDNQFYDMDIQADNEKYVNNTIKELSSVIYKMKKINQIKDNLNSIQDDCLGYHEKFKDTIKRNNSARVLRKENSEKNN